MVPAASVHRLQRRGQPFDGGHGQLGEQRQRAQQRDLHERHRGARVQAEQGAPADRGRSGSTAATPSSAARLPPRTSTGTSSAPSASPAIVSPSSTPNTWPMSWAGTERCSSVRLATSSTSRLAPTRASSATVPASPGPAASAASAAEQQRRGQDRAAQAAAGEQHPGGDGQDRARAVERVEVAGPGLGPAEHGHRQDDEQQVERADDDRPGGQQGQHEPQAGRRAASATHSPRPASTAAALPAARTAGTRSRATSAAAATASPAQTANTRPAPPADQPAGQQARRGDPGRLHPAHDHVGRGQLVRGHATEGISAAWAGRVAVTAVAASTAPA